MTITIYLYKKIFSIYTRPTKVHHMTTLSAPDNLNSDYHLTARKQKLEYPCNLNLIFTARDAS